MRGVRYIVRNKLYLAVTNECNSVSPIALRGPSFQMPESSKFAPLMDDYEPRAADLFKVVDDAFEDGTVSVDSMESDAISIAGLGEPLLRLPVITDAARMIKEKRHGAQLRVKTNGLVLSKDAAFVADSLKTSGVSCISISLTSDNPKQYNEIMKPLGPATFRDTCAFVIACVEAGLDVSCTAVEAPGVNISRVRSLAHSLGAPAFVSSKYYPLPDAKI
mmetsp:Transcript_30092/g.50321  ORF Transcript_30092/g.50321 Transcript_30092/m.50321 type:complete len:219 (-) Transcript_30092:110-766(-)